MGLFSADLNKAKPTGGGVYFEEGNHLVEVVAWKTIEVRANKSKALIVDCKIIESDNPTHTPGSIRNEYFGENDDSFAAKTKGLLMALCNKVDGRDDKEIEKEDWTKMLNASVTQPTLFLGKKFRIQGIRSLRKDAKKRAKEKPELLEDPAFMKKESFIKRLYSPA